MHYKTDLTSSSGIIDFKFLNIHIINDRTTTITFSQAFSFITDTIYASLLFSFFSPNALQFWIYTCEAIKPRESKLAGHDCGYKVDGVRSHILCVKSTQNEDTIATLHFTMASLGFHWTLFIFKNIRKNNTLQQWLYSLCKSFKANKRA